MKIIINADDFGIDYDRDIGIFFGVLFGYITSVSVVVTNKINFFRKMLIFLIKKKASVGLHINLTDSPLINFDIKELYFQDYIYKKNKYIFWRNALNDEINLEKIQNEIECQFKKFIEKYGFVPSHLDGHNHCNIFNKNIHNLFCFFAKKYNLHIRIPYEKITPYDKKILMSNEYFKEIDLQFEHYSFNSLINCYEKFIEYDMLLYNNICNEFKIKDDIIFIGTIYGYFRKTEVLYNQILGYKSEKVIQIMCHPGFYFSFLKHNTPFSNGDRICEYKVLRKLKKKMLGEGLFEYSNYKKIKE